MSCETCYTTLGCCNLCHKLHYSCSDFIMLTKLRRNQGHSSSRFFFPSCECLPFFYPAVRVASVLLVFFFSISRHAPPRWDCLSCCANNLRLTPVLSEMHNHSRESFILGSKNGSITSPPLYYCCSAVALVAKKCQPLTVALSYDSLHSW